MRHPVQDYYLTGLEIFQVPPEGHVYDPAKPPKYWRDPNASKSPKPKILYNVIAYKPEGGLLLDDMERPYLDQILITKAEAEAINVPSPETKLGPPYPNPIPPPMREFSPTDQLVVGFMGLPLVDDGVSDKREVGSGLTEAEHACLFTILVGVQKLLDGGDTGARGIMPTAAPKVSLFDLLQYLNALAPTVSAIQQFQAMRAGDITREMVDSAFQTAAEAGAEIYWQTLQRRGRK